MLEFLDVFINSGLLSELFDGLFDGILYDNPLILFYWIFVVSFIIYFVKRILFGV